MHIMLKACVSRVFRSDITMMIINIFNLIELNRNYYNNIVMKILQIYILIKTR